MKDKNGNELSDEVYRVVKKPGTDLANSRETEGRKRALLQDEDGGMKGPPELVEVEPEIRERTIVRTRVIEKKPSFLGQIGRDFASQALQEAPGIVRDVIGAVREHNAAKEREEQRRFYAQQREEQRKNLALQKEILDKQIELEKIKEQQRIAEEERQKYDRLTAEQKQVFNLSKALNDAYYGFEQDMTKDEACRSLVRAFLHFVMFLKEIQNVKNARIIDDETGEAIEGTEWIISLPWGQFLQDFNLLLKANPGWLKKYDVMMLSDAFDREIIVDGVYQPITATEFQNCLSIGLLKGSEA